MGPGAPALQQATAVRGPHTAREQRPLATTRESPRAAKDPAQPKIQKKKQLSGNTKDPEEPEQS